MSVITLSPDTLVTTPTAGQIEYNGTGLFYTPTGTQRGIIPGQQFYALNSGYVGLNATGAQTLLGLTNGVTLTSSTQYAFEIVFAVVKTSGTTAHLFSVGFGGTATLNNINYFLLDISSNTSLTAGNTAGGSGAYGMYIQTASATQINSFSTNATYVQAYLLKGIVSVNAGGALLPQYTLSAAPGGAYTTQAGSYMLIYPIGSAGANVSIGTWA